MSNNARAAKIPVIPPVPSDASPASRKTLEAIKQAIEVMAGTRGNELDKVVSKRDLESLGLNTKIIDTPVTYDFSDNVVNSNGPVPNPPRGLEILQRVVANKLTWEDPADGKFTHIEVWASKGSQSFSDAELVGYVNKGIEEFEHGYVNVRSDYYYWIRSVNSYGKYSVWHPTLVQGGMLASAIVDETINDLLAQLMDDDKYQTTHKIVADSFQVIQPTEGLEEGKKVFVVGQIDGRPAVGIDADMFVDGAVVARMIDANAITAEHIGTNEIIANSANIKTGVITNAHIKDYIRSNNYSSGSTGWNINKNGSAEFNNVTVRGTVEAAEIKSSYFNVGDFKIRSESASEKYCPLFINKADYLYYGAGVDYTIANLETPSPFYAYDYGSELYHASRVAKRTQTFHVKGSVGSIVVSGTVYLQYSINNGASWVTIKSVTSSPAGVILRASVSITASGVPIRFRVRGDSTTGDNYSRVDRLDIEVQTFNM